VKAFCELRAFDPAMDDAVRELTLRYEKARDLYQSIVDDNTELAMTGGTPSAQALFAEEQAFEDLDVARHRLLDAAARAYPTIQ
jgi:hypothetical protein